jgi:hypothetical protein
MNSCPRRTPRSCIRVTLRIAFVFSLLSSGNALGQTELATPAVATTTTVAASPNPVTGGTGVTLMATVKKSSGTGTPTGKITFSLHGTALAVVSLDGSGVAMLTAPTSGQAAGTYPVVASYAGDSGDSASSGTVNVVLKAAPTTTALTATPNPVQEGANVTLSATVTRTVGGGTPTGTVTFKSGSQVLTKIALNTHGVAAFTASSEGYPPGTYPIVATYGGDSYGAGSSSAPLKVVIQGLTPTTTTLTVMPTTFLPGDTVKMTATVSPSSATGNVLFEYDNFQIGTLSLSNGKAVWNMPLPLGLPTGTFPMTAYYLGDTTHAASTSNAVTVTY